MRKLGTFEALVLKYGGIDIPLEEVAEEYLGIGPKKAQDYARLHKLPFPVYQASSQKSPRMVRADDLARYLDGRYNEARREWNALHGA